MWRSLFFAPANRPDLVAKFHRIPADTFVVDLEDGTPYSAKTAARAELPDILANVKSNGPLSGSIFVRINDLGGEFGQADMDAVLDSEMDGIVIPKVEKIPQIKHVADAFDLKFGKTSHHQIILGIESIGGVLKSVELAQCSNRVTAMFFGAEDLATQMGARRTRAGTEVLFARQQVLLAAKNAGVAAIDQAVTEIRDDDLFREDSKLAREFGYDGKICLNPRQVILANESFLPTEQEFDRARELVTAFEEAEAEGKGTIDFRGAMVDEPLVKRARDIIALYTQAART